MLTAGFEVESNVPVPAISRYRGGRKVGVSKYPFASLEIGQSFFLPGKKRGSGGAIIASRYKSQGRDRIYTLRTVEGGIRIWRVK